MIYYVSLRTVFMNSYVFSLTKVLCEFMWDLMHGVSSMKFEIDVLRICAVSMHEIDACP